MRVRLKDIAQELGVSTVTVSKVLRGNADISERTRTLVLQRMRELNYRPNLLARSLSSGRSYAVGLVVPDLVHTFFAEFAKALSTALRPKGIAVILASSEEDPRIEAQEIEALLSRSVDVLLLASCQPVTAPSLPWGNRNTPLMLIDRNLPMLSTNFLGSDDVRVGQIATEHLLAIGRRRIAHIGGPKISPSLDRCKGYRQALAAAGIQARPADVVERDRVEEAGDREGFQAMQQLLAQREPPDAVFCYNDLTALGAMHAITAAGLRIPEDIAVVGCGNLRYADYLKVPLTSVDHGTERLGELAAALTLQLIAEPARPTQKLLLEPQLVVRQSSVAQ